MAVWWTCALVLLSALAGVSRAEDFEYVLMFMENYVEGLDNDQDVELYVASRSTSAVSVTISNPLGSVLVNDITFTLAPDTVEMYALPATARQVTELGNKAIKVVGDGDIIVYALNRNLFSTDGFTAFSVDQVGKEYYALCYTPEYNTLIGLVAVEDGVTDIDITVPSATTVEWAGTQYNGGQTFRVTLQYKYHSASIKSTSGDLTGARILASQKVSAYSGNVRASVDGTSRDHLVEQLPPLIQWGFTYFTVSTPARTPDRPDIVRIIAHEDNTQVEVKGGLTESFVINAGEYRELTTYGPLFIDSGNVSIMVGVISTSQSLDSVYRDIDEGDPSMLIIPAVGQYSADYVFSTPRYIKPPNADSTEYDIYLLVIANTTDTIGLALNGLLLDNANWEEIADTGYSSGEFSVDNDATYKLQHANSSARFMALLYGSADRESFYFPIDVGMININVITPVEIEGNQGQKGAQGSVGIAGATGPKGISGERGNIGVPGTLGVIGDKGDKGSAGSPSAFGATGSHGATGSTGGTGPAGTVGVAGSPGSTGIKGLSGLRGDTGDQGASGSPGAAGTAGSVGERGYKGPSGAAGLKGEPGDQGIQGVRGPVGAKGAKGYVAMSSCDDKCSVRDSTQPATCRTTYGDYSYLCSCPPGFQLTDSDPDLCIDIDECDLSLCSHTCVNSLGSYTCTCPSGYELVGNTCIDIDECATSFNPCGTAVCVNAIGSYLCLSQSAPAAQASRAGLQSLLTRGYFIAILCLLILLTILIIIVAMCLLSRHRKRYRSNEPVTQSIHYNPQPVIFVN